MRTFVIVKPEPNGCIVLNFTQGFKQVFADPAISDSYIIPIPVFFGELDQPVSNGLIL